MNKIPKHIRLVLNETDTIFLLDINSCIALKGTEEGDAALKDNELYDQLTNDLQRLRKVSSIGVQTIPVLRKTRNTEPFEYSYTDSSTFASNWEMHDTYKEQERLSGATLELFTEDQENDIVDENFILESDCHKLIEEISPQELQKSQQRKQLEKLENCESYFNAVLVIERLLANNCYNKQQNVFKGLLNDKLEDQPKYNYKLDLLWTFSNEDTRSRCVTALSFNPLIEDVIAVGYGKYYFLDRKSTGVVMIWNIKNPKQPEREYYFQHSVTSLQFSVKNPNFLVIGFYSGVVRILNISTRELSLVAVDSTSSFEPVWDIVLLQQGKEEYLLICFGDGQICKYKLYESDNHLERIQIMKIEKIEGKLNGISSLRLFEGNEISSSRFASANCLCLQPKDSSVYLVSTNEGVIHKCHSNYCTQHISMFKAHEGRIHTIKFSPFVSKVYATCGDDFQKCLWVEGINEPIITSRFCLEPVLDLDWSPSHSTILASLREMDIYLWDLQRKMYLPQSQTKSPTNSRNSLCKFTQCGRSLLVGDVDGNVHVFSVSGLPKPAFFQDNLFLQSIKNILVANTELLNKLKKVDSLNH